MFWVTHQITHLTAQHKAFPCYTHKLQITPISHTPNSPHNFTYQTTYKHTKLPLTQKQQLPATEN